MDVRPEDLRRGAALLRDDAGRVGAALGPAAEGAATTATGAGDGPLAEAADALAGRLDALLRIVTGSITECADALEAASTEYLATDQGTAAGLGEPGAPPVVLPGLEPPR
ncbi:hypothetical protein [Actinomycetospora lemnae]|uniref:Excreted virulence factor EspC (Type VII ESX diderm) n=1 Tax=Actinomycetospora lemnae TaxID=3019891 RepID=A0ABT5SW60_9PSEU|nr:hypothetical protein [Actinomycetospora sp. DW7H6]MDD7967090.1 hypothetical protein [Actinomycetospora sp. DW7H6]